MTAQIHEKLIIDGKAHTMAFCPPLPQDSNEIVEVESSIVRKDIKDQKLPQIIFSTACWRGYIGIWEIKDKKLYLNKIVGRYRKVGDQPLFADWFSGVLRIPSGGIKQYVHMGFGSVFEKELHIKIEKGLVVQQREIDNSSKNVDKHKLALSNMPGNENKFEGDDM